MVLSRRSEEVEYRRRLAHWQKDKDVVGLEDERQGLSIATIVGMGGIGKSSLARRLYNDGDVSKQFHRGWVVVSSEFRPGEIMKELLLQLLEPTEDKLKVSEIIKEFEVPNLQQMLHKRLQGTRYFIVMDDVWEDAHLAALANAFPDEDKGSRLVLTSRKRVITNYTRYVHSMKLLDSNESWKLFLKKPFIDNTDGKCPKDLENIGRQILNKCNGLPLAISVVGGLLVKQKQSKSEWEKVLKGINSHLGRSGSHISAILELSYHNLPPQLKPCFLCLGFFKEDDDIRAKKLVHIWIAQGFIPQEGELTMEEIARGYLEELINRNLVQVKEMNTLEDKVKTCHMHDLLHELSIIKAKEEISLKILREEGKCQSSHKPRHRVMYCSGGRFIDSTSQNNHLRSLFIHGAAKYFDGSSSTYWKSFKLLRLLDLEGCRSLMKLPDAVGALIGSKYLGLRSTGIWKLPHSLTNLKNLQVLDIRNLTLIMPNVLWRMDSLRHLYVSAISCKVPLRISTLKNIQTLSYLPLRYLNIEQVKQITTLCELGIDLDEVSDVSNLFTSLAMLENLICLDLRDCRCLNLDGLGTLHHFTQLKLVGRMTALPSASNFPPNLSYLSLVHAYLTEDPMPILEQLPKLMYLKVDYAYAGDKMIISCDGFPKLKVLFLQMLFVLRNITVGKGAMSELKRLEINKCPLLRASQKK